MKAQFLFGTIVGSQKLKTIAKKKLNKRSWFRNSELSLEDEVNSAMIFVMKRLKYNPIGFQCTIKLLENEQEMDEIQRRNYGKVRHPNAYAYASLSSNIVWVRANRISKYVLRHEFAHLLLHDALESKRLASLFHEVVANFCEKDHV